MWKRALDIFPGEWVGTDHEKELQVELNIGDFATVIVDSQFQDKREDGTRCPRCIGKTGMIIEIDKGDEWSYKLGFFDGTMNWFKRYVLRKCE